MARARTELERRLLDEFQRDFPLEPRPFAAVAERLGVDEATVIATLGRLKDEGSVSRVGAVFRPGGVGESTLAAMAVPVEDLPYVAQLVNEYEEVNHNYEREHRLNLWFVVCGPDRARVEAVLRDISTRTGLAVLDLPMVQDYHLDLGFPLRWN
ncbi:MAG: AsnC family transcriptional regulator [Magnetospirillum sp. WYHS-4]